MNESLVLIGLGVLAAVFILRPLVRGRESRTARGRAVEGPAHPTAPDELAELELDRAMGRVSEADYDRWRGELVADMVARVPATTVESPPDATGRAEALVRQWREAPRPVCPTCGIRPQPEAKYCSNCGNAV